MSSRFRPKEQSFTYVAYLTQYKQTTASLSTLSRLSPNLEHNAFLPPQEHIH